MSILKANTLKTLDETVSIEVKELIRTSEVALRFLKARADVPTSRDNGSPLRAGDTYYNTTEKLEYSYDGTVWTSVEDKLSLVEEKLQDFKETLESTNDASKGSGAIGNSIISVSSIDALKVMVGLKAGQRVRTTSYYEGTDVGGGFYSIVTTNPGWGIALTGGLFAVLKDDFCITKFGIKNSPTLDQTENLKSMCLYADTYVYEIDFLGYHIQTPNILGFTSSRGTVFRGLTFFKIHKLKNLYIHNPKGVTLTYGWTCIQFIPKDTGRGLFELENITFDPYTTTYSIPIGEEDGAMCGFACRRFNNLPSLRDCNYDFKYTNIHFLSAAVSYNINTADVFSNNVKLQNMTGEYWGLYAFQFTKNLQAEEVHGWFRDDYHATSGRTLVTNLIHDEPEIGGSSVDLGNWSVKNCSSRKNTSGNEHVVFKHHSVGVSNFQSCVFENIVGDVEFYAAVNSSVKSIKAKNVSRPISANIKFDSLLIDNCQLSESSFNTPLANRMYGSVELRNSNVTRLGVLGTPACTISKLKLVDCTVADMTYGLLRSASIAITEIEIYTSNLNSPYILECPFNKLTIDDCRIPQVSWANAIFNRRTSGTATILITNLISKGSSGADSTLVTTGGVNHDIEMYHTILKERPKITPPFTLTEFSVFPVKPAV